MSPTILALDTTTEYGSLALLCGADLLEEVTLHAPSGFAHVLYGHLADLLARHSMKVDAIDCFAAASGPGSFTGVRVGLACIKGLAEAVGRRAVAVSNLQAIATFGAAPLRAPVVDARRGEVYGAVYDAESRLVSAEVVAPLDVWRASLPGDSELVEWGFTKPPRALAGAIARLAAKAEWQDPAALDANYVRRSDAELLWKE